MSADLAGMTGSCVLSVGVMGLFKRVLILRLALALALGAVLLGALTPLAAYVPAASMWDKANHALAFAVLAVLCALAYPGVMARYLALLLLALGVLIEGLQAIPQLHRSAEFGDILADVAGIAAGFAAINLARLIAARAGGKALQAGVRPAPVAPPER